MSNFDGIFETVDSIWADLSRNLGDIRYETEDLERQYSQLLTLLGVSDHESAVVAIQKLKSDSVTSLTTEKNKATFAESKAKTFRDVAGVN